MPNNERTNDSIKSLLTIEEYSTGIYFSPSDIGVRRNFGRAGTRYAPLALINTFFKMGKPELQNEKIKLFEVTNIKTESEDFAKSQLEQSAKILNDLDLSKKNIHIGGGHDHVYPMLLSLQERLNKKKLVIINIDAHLDTRIDIMNHSGTPFRDFDKNSKVETTLLQYGIHQYSNSKTTQSPLERINQLVFKKSDHKFFEELKNLPKDAFVFLSLDADAIDSTQMQAVSAVNFDGVKLDEIKEIINVVKGFKNSMFGIYEYNPIYDDLSQKGARNLSSLIYDYLL